MANIYTFEESVLTRLDRIATALEEHNRLFESYREYEVQRQRKADETAERIQQMMGLASQVPQSTQPAVIDGGRVERRPRHR